MDTNDFKIFCINLSSRPDRWEQSRAEFHKIFLDDVCRFSAIEDKDPVAGCALSHFSIMKSWVNMGSHLMIFEDDVQFINTPFNLNNYLAHLEIPIQWDMLYLGANICGSFYQQTSKLARLTHAQSTHAYCINRNFIPHLLSYQSYVGKPLDLIYTENIVPYYRCYITIPMLAIQRPSYSDIEKKFVNYDWMEQRYYNNFYADNNLGKD